MKNTVTSKIEILREIQKELETRKAWRSLFNEDFLSIDYDVHNHVLFCNWKGYQTEASIKTGCEKILDAMVSQKCRTILNDNTNVLGIWTPASAWMARDWFPRMIKGGLKKFAWIYSPAALSRVSTDETLKQTTGTGHAIKTFTEVASGMAWLKS